MYNGHIILDAFNHGLRDFPELPVVLSSQLEGSDIEYYYRQNREIADYDLIGMPKDFLSVVVLQTNMHEQLVCPMGIWRGDLQGGAMTGLLEWELSINELNAFAPELGVLPGVDEKEPGQRTILYSTLYQTGAKTLQ